MSYLGVERGRYGGIPRECFTLYRIANPKAEEQKRRRAIFWMRSRFAWLRAIGASMGNGNRSNVEWFTQLSSLLQDPKVSVVTAAIRALGDTLTAGSHEDHRATVELLIKRVAQEVAIGNSPHEEQITCAFLGVFLWEELRSLLVEVSIQLSQHEDPIVRMTAGGLMQWIPVKETEQHTLRLFLDPQLTLSLEDRLCWLMSRQDNDALETILGWVDSPNANELRGAVFIHANFVLKLLALYDKGKMEDAQCQSWVQALHATEETFAKDFLVTLRARKDSLGRIARSQ